jgi:hypothetical protein
MALVQFRTDGSGDAAAKGGWQDPAAVGTQRARRRHPLQARLHGSAGQAQLLGKHHDGQPGILIECREDSPVR